jgi:putative CocE/NonD family hydrolase
MRYAPPLTLIALFGFAAAGRTDIPDKPAQYIKDNYTRQTQRVPMRDGVRLHTIVYAPRDTKQKYPVLLFRTPYGIPPYADDQFRTSLGPNPHFIKEGYIFVYQDVRGCYMSEGDFENMRPQLAPGQRGSDESTDTYDTIDWLLKNVAGHNGKVGQFGISYPGFYTAAGMINAHPALKASSPQAPIADWFFDDFYHHGALFLAHSFTFFNRFGQPRPEPTQSRPGGTNFGTPDGYQFFLDLGPLKNANPRHFKNQIAYFDTLGKHNTYDAFWKARNLRPHLKNVAPAVMTVGGWYDAEDLFGIFNTYRSVERQNPGVFNVLVVGPWSHGGWSRRGSTGLGNIDFGTDTAAFFQENIELPFFNQHLKGKGAHELPEAYVFETGLNRWRKFDHWPPRQLQPFAMYLGERGRLTSKPPTDSEASDSFPSDPRRPVPYTERIRFGMAAEYMTDDQRFASRRPDVLVYQTAPLDQDLTVAGPIEAELFVSTTATDADWVVKVIDVLPADSGKAASGAELGGYQMHVRSEVLRGRFRNSYEKPEPFVSNEPARVRLELQDVLHTFRKGHRLMVQIHSSWFPLVDRNPQKYVPSIFHASEDDFIPATHRVYRSQGKASVVRVGLLLE